MRALLEQLEATGQGVDTLAVPLAFLAGDGVDHDTGVLNAAVRRAELLLAAGGDPRRTLEPDGRAVRALAAELDGPGARAALDSELRRLLDDAEGLATVGETLRALLGDGELAWRCYAMAILADALSAED